MVTNVLTFLPFFCIGYIVEQAEAIIVVTVQLSLEFALCYLERSEFGSEDMTIQVFLFLFFIFLAMLERPVKFECNFCLVSHQLQLLLWGLNMLISR